MGLRTGQPLLFIVLLLAPCGWFFSGLDRWWLYQLSMQLIICGMGLCWVGSRLLALLCLVLLIVFNAGWVRSDATVPIACFTQIDQLTGIASRDAFRLSGVVQDIQLIKVAIYCRDQMMRFPVAVVRLKSDEQQRQGWFRTGDRLELNGIRLVESDRWSLIAAPLDRFRVYNRTFQDSSLHRGKHLLYLQSKARYYLGDFPAALYTALITADRSKLDPDWRQQIRELGIAHIFAISGMHIGIIYLWLSIAIRFLLSFSNAWIEKGFGLLVSDIVCILLIGAFVEMIGTPVSAQRAIIMLMWWIVIRHFLTWQPPWFILFGTALVILIDSPTAIGQLPFQLSFLSVAGILQILPLLPSRGFRTGVRQLLTFGAISSLLLSSWLFLLTLPLICLHFPTFSLLAPVNNVVHVFFLGTIFLPLGIAITFLLLMGYPCWGVPGEYFLFAVLQLLGKTWEWLLQWNTSLNRLLLISTPERLHPLAILVYWFLLMSLLQLFIRSRQRWTMDIEW
jgi:ComEC/Rec2-related protein